MVEFFNGTSTNDVTQPLPRVTSCTDDFSSKPGKSVGEHFRFPSRPNPNIRHRDIRWGQIYGGNSSCSKCSEGKKMISGEAILS